MKTGLSALCKRGPSVRAGALRAVLRLFPGKQHWNINIPRRLMKITMWMMERNQTEKQYCKRGRKGTSYYLKCLPAEDTSVGFWQNKRTLQRKSEKCCFAKYSTVSSEIICVHNFQSLEQKVWKRLLHFFSQRQGEYIFPYKSKGWWKKFLRRYAALVHSHRAPPYGESLCHLSMTINCNHCS